MSEALKREGDGPFPESWWSEEDGDVLWWAWIDGKWLGEAPYAGSPLECGITVEMRSADKPKKVVRHDVGGWPGYHTHWTRLPAMPPAPSGDAACAGVERVSVDVSHKMAMDAIGLAAHLLTPQTEALMALVEAERSMHSYLHITDPTLYIRALNDKGLDQQVRLAKAALAFVAEVQKVKSELQGQAT